jgi:hypothetical protein
VSRWIDCSEASATLPQICSATGTVPHSAPGKLRNQQANRARTRMIGAVWRRGLSKIRRAAEKRATPA